MSPVWLRRLPWGFAAAVLLSAALGFLLGFSGPAVRAGGDSEPATAVGSASPRESTLALRTLGAGGRWGAYDAPEAETPAPTAAPVPDLEGIARDYRLVGIERGVDGPVALLLPVSGGLGNADIIRLKAGQPLADGITLDTIASDSVSFSTTAGTSSLHLYDGAQP